MKRCNFTGIECSSCSDDDYELCGCDGDCGSCDHAAEDEEDELW